MKLTIISILLAATSASAAPAMTKRSNSLQITDLEARAAGGNSATLSFVLTDPVYPGDTPTDCNMHWTYGSSPNQSARCNNGEYYIKFPQGVDDFNRFTLELIRVNGSIPEDGQALLDSNLSGDAPGTKWICVSDPEPNVQLDCHYNGTLEIGV
ncbi:hypothetical protein N7462_001314 [Penicillium macrosclerotiorum]|uniref:uncharacterized protein n=1 Tax=Penicillium macrosclerotiorum TaxID=303699 RepID=UPI002547ACC7|nr:uncharacterized protein N7462_001314 [Penicillium macrosclerotiorum]KAJ5691891.1 hypothetical protein N7462_001314 [Penicillium macrosclerotiorum]